MPRLARAALLLGAVLLTGCAINPPLQLAPLAQPGGVDLTPRVPFHPQTDYQCGPAALATVLGASGVATSPEALVSQVYLPGRQGSLQFELMGASRRAGRIPYPVAAEPAAVVDELQAGRPVLVLQNLLTRTVPQWHYAVVVGADPARNRVLLNSGEKQGLAMKAPSFLRTWDWAGRWGLVMLRPGELPATADADPARYLTAVADFEAVAGSDAARPAYAAALSRWPDEPRVQMALGNQSLADGKQQDAIRHYRRGLELAPGDPVLSNNYASVMAGLGCRNEALDALDRVAAGDTLWQQRLRDTRGEVLASKASRNPACRTLALPATAR